jgi:hypothetical protein
VGDDGAALFGRAVSAWDGWVEEPHVVVADDVACGSELAPAGGGAPPTCAAWIEEWGHAVAGVEPDVVILAVANLDVEALLEASGDTTPDGLDALDSVRARDRIRGALALLGEQGARVVVAELPSGAGTGTPSLAEARMGMGYSVLRDAAMGEPGVGFVGREEFPPLVAGADPATVEGWPTVAAPHLTEDLLSLVDPGGARATATPLPRVLVVGDSVSWFLGHALEARAADTGDLWAWNAAVYGCGIGRGGEIAVSWGAQATAVGCDGWADRWGAQIEQFDPDVVVALTGLWDLTDRRRPEWGGFRHVGDPAYDEWLLGEFEAAVEVLSAQGARVVWLTSPCTEDLRGGVLAGSGAWDPARLRHLNEVLLPALERRRDEVVLADLHALACPGGTFTQTIGGHSEARRDGVHFSGSVARYLADILVPEILAARRQDGLDG